MVFLFLFSYHYCEKYGFLCVYVLSFLSSERWYNTRWPPFAQGKTINNSYFSTKNETDS